MESGWFTASITGISSTGPWHSWHWTRGSPDSSGATWAQCGGSARGPPPCRCAPTGSPPGAARSRAPLATSSGLLRPWTTRWHPWQVATGGDSRVHRALGGEVTVLAVDAELACVDVVRECDGLRERVDGDCLRLGRRVHPFLGGVALLYEGEGAEGRDGSCQNRSPLSLHETGGSLAWRLRGWIAPFAPRRRRRQVAPWFGPQVRGSGGERQRNGSASAKFSRLDSQPDRRQAARMVVFCGPLRSVAGRPVPGRSRPMSSRLTSYQSIARSGIPSRRRGQPAARREPPSVWPRMSKPSARSRTLTVPAYPPSAPKMSR